MVVHPETANKTLHEMFAEIAPKFKMKGTVAGFKISIHKLGKDTSA
jgi:hypothetical protein